MSREGTGGGWRDMAEEGHLFVGILWLKLLTNHGEERKHLTNQSETNSKKIPFVWLSPLSLSAFISWGNVACFKPLH